MHRLIPLQFTLGVAKPEWMTRLIPDLLPVTPFSKSVRDNPGDSVRLDPSWSELQRGQMVHAGQ